MSRGDKIEPQTTSNSITKKRGPPFKLDIDENLINQIETLAGLGLTLEDISLVLKINESSFHRYKDRFPQIVQAVENGRAKAKETSGKALIRKVQEGDLPSIKWFEQTRFGYSEKIKTENEHTVKHESLENYLKRMKDVGNETQVLPSNDSISDSFLPDNSNIEKSTDDKTEPSKT